MLSMMTGVYPFKDTTRSVTGMVAIRWFWLIQARDQFEKEKQRGQESRLCDIPGQGEQGGWMVGFYENKYWEW